MTNLERIQTSRLYQRVMADSHGGIIYDTAKLDTYDDEQVKIILSLWDYMSDAEQENADGILKGAIDFLQGAL